MPSTKTRGNASRKSMGLRLPGELKEELQQHAEAEHRPLSNLVKDWLYAELERRSKRRRGDYKNN